MSVIGCEYGLCDCGFMEVTIAGETRVAGPGCAAVVPLNTSHAVRARTDARTIVVDHPRRHRIGGVETR